MSLSTEDYLEFCTNFKPTRLLKFLAETSWLEGGETDRLKGAVTVLFLQGFITESTQDRYFRLLLRIANKETTLRSRR